MFNKIRMEKQKLIKCRVFVSKYQQLPGYYISNSRIWSQSLIFEAES